MFSVVSEQEDCIPKSGTRDYLGTHNHYMEDGESYQCSLWTDYSSSINYFPDATVVDAANYCRYFYSVGYLNCYNSSERAIRRCSDIPKCRGKNRANVISACL